MNAQVRTGRGKNAARALRRTGRVPAAIHGHGDESRSLSLSAHELEKVLAHGGAGTTVIDLQIEGGGSTQALIRELQVHPYRPVVLHVDFLQLHAGEVVKMQVPVRILNAEAAAHDAGGILDQVLYTVEVECLPRDIMDAVEIDATGMSVGDSIRVRDIATPNIRITNDDDLPVASMVAPAQEIEEPVATESEDGVGGSVEPTLIRDRQGDIKDVETTEQNG
ncbi:MAG: 50S ribosomal protein L25 [Gemmatimonadetes bacterium]|nr:50S ribosomal protein L25 [Gemmatimonadota bacterium]